jgi:hypothetical protein
MCSRRITLTDDTVHLHLAQAISGEERVQVEAAIPPLNLQKKYNWLHVEEDITFHVMFSSLRMWTPFLVEPTQSCI